jgi:hypothetical protein
MDFKELNILDVERSHARKSCWKVRTKFEKLLILVTLVLSAALIISLFSLIVTNLKDRKRKNEFFFHKNAFSLN